MIINPRDGVEHFLIRCRQTVRPISDVHLMGKGPVWIRVAGVLELATAQAKIQKQDVHLFIERTFDKDWIAREDTRADWQTRGPYGQARIIGIKRASNIDLVIRLLGEPKIDVDALLATI